MNKPLFLNEKIVILYHTKLVDRFFQQIYAGNDSTNNNIANLATGKENFSTDKDEQNIVKSIAGASDTKTYDFSDVDEQEQSLSSRFAGVIDAKIAAGTASEVETITNAYVLDTTQAEDVSYTAVEIILRIFALIVLVFIMIVIYFMATDKNMGEELQKLICVWIIKKNVLLKINKRSSIKKATNERKKK